MAAMAVEKILAEVPAMLVQRVQSGAAERVGMIVRDTASKQILAHLQETAATQTIFNKVLAVGANQATGIISQPIATLTGLGTLIQNEQIKGRLNTLTSMIGGMQAIQMATLVTSVAGIGVTAASTAMILSRLQVIDTGLSDLRSEIQANREHREDFDIKRVLSGIQTRLERIEETSSSHAPEAEIRASEEKLHEGFNDLEHGMQYVLARDTISPEFLLQMLAALSLAGSAQIKCLIWLDEKQRASDRAVKLFQSMSRLTQYVPADVLSQKLGSDPDITNMVLGISSEVRMRVAAIPSLSAVLLAGNIHGRAYIDRLEQETDSDMLMLPARG